LAGRTVFGGKKHYLKSMDPHASDAGPFEAATPSTPLVDGFARRISYVRISVTDRCDFRCVYCMSENMHFLPKADLLTLEELERLAKALISRGVRKIRLTGGEPLVRRNVMQLFRGLATQLGRGLNELTLTTNGSQLARHARELAECGVRRVNVSLDTLDPDKFRALTRGGDHAQVLAGIDGARQAGLRVKINCVALKGVNDGEFRSLTEWAHRRGMDISFIEVMPLGEDTTGNVEHYLPLDQVAAALARKYTLTPSAFATGGPARYFDVAQTGGRVGLITPLSHNFCESCNRVRVTCTGTLYMCLGQEDKADLRAPLRASSDDAALHAALDEAMRRKPRGHDFVEQWAGAISPLHRPMSMTGG
jgi:GTP 3',8-cyclase